MVLDVQTFMEISASIKDYGCAKRSNKHVSIAISVLNDWLPNAIFFQPLMNSLHQPKVLCVSMETWSYEKFAT